MQEAKKYFNFDPKKLLKVKVSDVRPNTWNPKDPDDPDYEKVKRSVEINGLTQPIFVRENDNGESKYEILDGEHRWRSARDLNFENIYVYNEGEVPDDYAKSLTLWHEVSVGMSEADLAPLVVELNQLNFELPYNELEIEGFENLAKFDFNESYKEQTPIKTNDDDFEQLTIKMTPEEFEIVNNAIKKVKDEYETTEGGALKIICEQVVSSEES